MAARLLSKFEALFCRNLRLAVDSWECQWKFSRHIPTQLYWNSFCVRIDDCFRNINIFSWRSTVRVRKWSQDRKWSRTANDPQIGPQMIPDRKWSPYWTANDPDQKIRNGMDGRIGWIGNWCTWIPIFFSLCLNGLARTVYKGLHNWLNRTIGKQHKQCP